MRVIGRSVLDCSSLAEKLLPLRLLVRFQPGPATLRRYGVGWTVTCGARQSRSPEPHWRYCKSFVRHTSTATSSELLQETRKSPAGTWLAAANFCSMSAGLAWMVCLGARYSGGICTCRNAFSMAAK